MYGYAVAGLPFDTATAKFTTEARQLQAAAGGVELDHLGDGLDELFSARNQDVFQFVRLQQNGLIGRFGPQAQQLGT